MVLLLVCSGVLSGSETAFFNISIRQLELFRSSNNKFSKLSGYLLSDPKQLLTSLLFGNMAVNVLYFALASLLSISMTRTSGATVGAIFAFLPFVALLLFGEMLPKSIAYSHSQRFCITAAPFCFVCVRILSPLLKVFDFFIVAPAVRFLSGPITPSGPGKSITTGQLISLIDASRQRGLITEDENQLFAEVIELGLLKVRHVMRPRVDMVCSWVGENAETIQKVMIDNKATKIPVYKEDIDKISGLIHLRDIMLSPETQAEQLIKEVNFVPEQKTVESLLIFFRRSRTDTAIVVDEYGGIAGIVSLEDIVEELIGPLEMSQQFEAVELIGPLKYRLAGNLAIHDWAAVFGIEPAQCRMSTIGGLTTALLGKIPKPGDTVSVKNISLTVEKIQKRRIETLILSLEPVEEKDK